MLGVCPVNWSVALLCLALYFIPTIVGWGHRNAASVTVINVFLGWTFIGWVVALAMAVYKE